jgi:hypothetical protein
MKKEQIKDELRILRDRIDDIFGLENKLQTRETRLVSILKGELGIDEYTNPEVKVHFFKQSGKWYDSHTMKWARDPDEKWQNGKEILRNSIRESNVGYKSMSAVCINNPKGYPIMIKKVGGV